MLTDPVSGSSGLFSSGLCGSGFLKHRLLIGTAFFRLRLGFGEHVRNIFTGSVNLFENLLTDVIAAGKKIRGDRLDALQLAA